MKMYKFSLCLLICLFAVTSSHLDTITRNDILSYLKHVEAKAEIPPRENKAETARFIMHNVDWAAMATISTREPTKGQPFANIFSVSDGPRKISTGVPYLYVMDGEMSMRDIKVNPHASLTMTLAETSFCKKKGYDPQYPLCSKITLNGKLTAVAPGSKEEAFAKWALFSRHPGMHDWPEDHGFYVAKLKLTSICILDYFGGPSYVPVEDYFKANISTYQHNFDFTSIKLMK